MAKKNIWFGAFLFSILAVVLFSSGVLALSTLANTTAPASGTNSSGSVTLICAQPFHNITDPNAINTLTNWSFINGATQTPITVTGLTCTNYSCSGTASASDLTDGLGLNITCSLGNGTSMIRGGENATNLDFYTLTPTCSFGIDRDHVEYQDALGITISSNASTKDPLSSLAYFWTLWRNDGTNSTTSTSGNPTFSDGNFDQIGEFKLGLLVTDRWFNRATCTNQSILVSGTNGDVTAIAVTTQQQGFISKIGLPIILIGSFLFLGIIAVIVILVITAGKKR